MQAFHHGALLGRHQARAHRSRDPERVLHGLGINLQQLAGRHRGDEGPRSPLGMKAVQEQRRRCGIADAKPDLVSNRERGSDIPA